MKNQKKIKKKIEKKRFFFVVSPVFCCELFLKLLSKLHFSFFVGQAGFIVLPYNNQNKKKKKRI